MNDITISQASILALLGYAVVFAGLLALMALTIVLGKCFTASAKKNMPAEAPATKEVPAPATAPGTAGQLKLYNTDPKTAAMVMAIVADKMGKPINELRFLSIKEVSQ